MLAQTAPSDWRQPGGLDFFNGLHLKFLALFIRGHTSLHLRSKSLIQLFLILFISNNSLHGSAKAINPQFNHIARL